ncbi:MAG: molybdopterin-dependent oxidoreductase [Planctomycetia bacterium]|nr:molybdopterin-dependent oxidoreductase [Planctomycetia bacterium]
MASKAEGRSQQSSDTQERAGRRTLLKAGVLGAIGLGAGAIFRGFSRVARAGGQEPLPTHGKRTKGPRDALVGESFQADVDGYVGKDGAQRVGVPSTCMQCIAACAIIGYREKGKIVKIEGNPYCANNRGMVCAKSQAGVNQVYDPDRLLYPLVRVGKRRGGEWKRLSMKEALDLVAFGGEIAGRKVEGLKAIHESGKPEYFMFHYGRSRIKPAQTHFVTTAFGSKTMGNHTSICETAKWLGNELTMGKHYDVNDVANSKYILIFGANVLEAHTAHSYLAQRLIEAKAAGTKIVTFDVRLSNTAAKSSEWIPIIPGTDLAVILAMTNLILNEQPYRKPLYDEQFINKWTNVSVDELRKHYARYTPKWAEKESGVAAETIRRIALAYGSNKPSTIVTYRGFVGHYNGAQAEWAARVLDGITGNFNVKGGTNVKVAGKYKDAYKDKVAKEHKEHVRKGRKLNISDGDNIHLPTHHTSQWIYEMIADGKAGRPKLYMTYVWNGAYTTGDCERNIEILCNEKYIPFIVAVDVAMSETTECADLILPDATYLERWTVENTQSFAMLPFLHIRQPVAPPLGEAMDMQDIFIQLARRIGGGMAALHPYESAEKFCEACIKLQVKDNEKSGKTFYDVAFRPLTGNAWEYFKKYGILNQATGPHYHAHEKKLKAKDIDGKTVDEKTGVIWDPHKAHVSDEDVAKKGYTGSKNAYKGYVGQMIDGVAYKGFTPDKINKSGRFEVNSEFMKPAAEKVMEDIRAFLRPDEESWVPEHLSSGLPSWVPVPEHRARKDGQLIMISFKVNVQIHSRSQNCKWLQEIWHNNPVWINPETARRLLGSDVKEGDVISIRTEMVELPWRKGKGTTKAREITARVHLTEGVHPEVIAVSYHCGHWAYGRYASGKAVAADLSGAKPDGETIWWQRGHATSRDPKQWSEISGIHPNWIITNMPARVSGQFRSNDTVVSVRRV